MRRHMSPAKPAITPYAHYYAGESTLSPRQDSRGKKATRPAAGHQLKSTTGQVTTPGLGTTAETEEEVRRTPVQVTIAGYETTTAKAELETRATSTGLESRPTSGLEATRASTGLETASTGLEMRASTGLETRPTAGRASTGPETRPTTGRASTGLETRPTTGLEETRASTGLETRPTTGL